MILTIDTLAERYKMLPSEIMARSTTFDLYVMDAAMSYHNYQQKKAQNHGVPPAPELSESEMLEIIRKTRKDG
ncbi:hypothetical protein UFOVP623_21 [uncultured Caudovirales phage]|uniref:Uncharacterized protein n=1 Tax=uncultured Caudovirales phage TaxID=2100421 RepID=A0A6J5ND61_9CAUD|nr:hypothetical protein UFOVP623_21 [uncultured Caudovirales phage]